MANPLYQVGNTVYLRESAAIGFLESVTIGGMSLSSTEWQYSIRLQPALPMVPPLTGDRIGLVQPKMLYFAESELVTLCDALVLMEINLAERLERVRTQLSQVCGVTG